MKLEMVHICIFILIGGSAIKDKKLMKKKYWRANIKRLRYQTSTNKPFEEFPVIDGDQNNDPPIFDIDNDDREPLLTPKFRRNRIQTTSTQSYQLKNTAIEREMWSSKRPDFIGPNGGKKEVNNEFWTIKTNIWGVTERTQTSQEVDVKMLTSTSLVNMTNFMTTKRPNLSSTTQQITSIKMSSVASSNSTQDNKMSTTIKTMMSSVTTPTSPNMTSVAPTTIMFKTDVDETGKPAVTDEDMTVTTTMQTLTSLPDTDVDRKETTTQFLEGNDETTSKNEDGKIIPSTEKTTTMFQDDEDRLGTSPSYTTTIKSITTLDVGNERRVEPTETMKTTMVDVDEPTKSEVKMTTKTDKDDKMTTNEAETTGPAVENIPGKFPVTTEGSRGITTQFKPDEPDAENVTLTTIKRFLLDVTTESEIIKPKTFMVSMEQISSTPNEDPTTKATILFTRADTADDVNLVTVKTIEPTTMVKTQAPTTIAATTTQKPLIASVKPTIKGASTTEAKDIGWNREPLLKSGHD